MASFGYPLWAVMAKQKKKKISVRKKYRILATQDVVVKARRTRE